MNYYYWSNDKKKSSIDVRTVVTALDADYEPYYYIKFVLTNGSKIQWEYHSKETRDKELLEIREQRDQYQKP